MLGNFNIDKHTCGVMCCGLPVSSRGFPFVKVTKNQQQESKKCVNGSSIYLDVWALKLYKFISHGRTRLNKSLPDGQVPAEKRLCVRAFVFSVSDGKWFLLETVQVMVGEYASSQVAYLNLRQEIIGGKVQHRCLAYVHRQHEI